MAFDADGQILAAHIDHVQDVGAYPTPWPVGTAAAVGMLFPGPYRVPAGDVPHDARCSRTRRAGRRTAARGSSSRSPVRCCSTSRRGAWASTPSSCGAGTCCGSDELPYANPNGMPYRRHHAAARPSSRRSRCSTTTRSAASRPRRERRAATSASARAPTSSRPRPGMGFYGTEGATIRIEPSGKVNVYVAGGSTGNSLETTVGAADRRRARRRHRTTSTRSRATPRSRRSARAPGGSRSGSMIAGAIAETAAVLRERIDRHRRAPARGGARRHRVLDRSQAAVRGTPSDRRSRWPRSPTIAYFQPAALPAGRAAGPRGERPLPGARRR